LGQASLKQVPCSGAGGGWNPQSESDGESPDGSEIKKELGATNVNGEDEPSHKSESDAKEHQAEELEYPGHLTVGHQAAVSEQKLQ
jgi:hypothetical protein